jgi:hypothetical protein
MLPSRLDGCMLSWQNLLDTEGRLDTSLDLLDENKGSNFC